MHSTESRFIIGSSNTLFSGVYGCIFQPGNFRGWGSEGVNNNDDDDNNNKKVRHFVGDFNIVLTTPATALVPGCVGSCPSLRLHQ